MVVRDLEAASGLDAVIQALQARGANTVERILTAAREHLGMDLAFVSEFTDEEEVILRTRGEHDDLPVQEGDRCPLESTYCQRAVQGRIPLVIPDSSKEPGVADIATAVRAYVGVPVRFSDGRLFGTLCCVSAAPDPSLGERDLKVMKVLGRLIGEQLEAEERETARKLSLARRIRSLLASREVKMMFQPVIGLADGKMAGVEALARFGNPPLAAPDVLLAQAAAVGLSLDLERAAAFAAVEKVSDLADGQFMAVNLSPAAIECGWFEPLVQAAGAESLVIEVTEHAQVDDYERLSRALDDFRSRGGRLAIDDAGAGFASLRHILRLSPDIIKLDATLTCNVDADPVRRALATALVEFAGHVGARIVAEGIQTPEEAETLLSLGVGFGQGNYLGAPGALEAGGPAGAAPRT